MRVIARQAAERRGRTMDPPEFRIAKRLELGESGRKMLAGLPLRHCGSLVCSACDEPTNHASRGGTRASADLSARGRCVGVDEWRHGGCYRRGGDSLALLLHLEVTGGGVAVHVVECGYPDLNLAQLSSCLSAQNRAGVRGPGRLGRAPDAAADPVVEYRARRDGNVADGT